jgi:hypothetical protein
MQIVVANVDRKTVVLDVAAKSTIRSVKLKVQAHWGTPHHHQRLIYGVDELVNEHKLSDYNVTDGSVLVVLLRLAGGAGGSLSVAVSALVVARFARVRTDSYVAGCLFATSHFFDN